MRDDQTGGDALHRFCTALGILPGASADRIERAIKRLVADQAEARGTVADLRTQLAEALEDARAWRATAELRVETAAREAAATEPPANDKDRHD